MLSEILNIKEFPMCINYECFILLKGYHVVVKIFCILDRTFLGLKGLEHSSLLIHTEHLELMPSFWLCNLYIDTSLNIFLNSKCPVSNAYLKKTQNIS